MAEGEWKDVYALARVTLDNAGVGRHTDTLLTESPFGVDHPRAWSARMRYYATVGVKPGESPAQRQRLMPPVERIPVEMWQNIAFMLLQPIRLVPLVPADKPEIRLAEGVVRRKAFMESFMGLVRTNITLRGILLRPDFRIEMYRQWLGAPLEGVYPGRSYDQPDHVWGWDEAREFTLPREPTEPLGHNGKALSPQWYMLFLDTIAFNEVLRMNACAAVRLQLAVTHRWPKFKGRRKNRMSLLASQYLQFVGAKFSTHSLGWDMSLSREGMRMLPGARFWLNRGGNLMSFFEQIVSSVGNNKTHLME